MFRRRVHYWRQTAEPDTVEDEAEPLLDDADIRGVVFDGPSVVVDVKARQRLFLGGTRVAVQLRDLERKGHESCDERVPRTEVDHIEPYTDGGPTVQANGRLLCRWHHRRRRRRP